MPEKNKSKSLADAQAELDRFPERVKSVFLATKDRQTEPYASYATFVSNGKDFVILISEMAEHFHNIRQHSHLSLMLIEDEQDAANPFVRQRLSYYCDAEFIPDGSELSRELEQRFIERYGAFARQLFRMDFHLVQCRPQQGRIVLGVGQAYSIDSGGRILEQLGDSAHRKREQVF